MTSRIERHVEEVFEDEKREQIPQVLQGPSIKLHSYEPGPYSQVLSPSNPHVPKELLDHLEKVFSGAVPPYGAADTFRDRALIAWAQHEVVKHLRSLQARNQEK